MIVNIITSFGIVGLMNPTTKQKHIDPSLLQKKRNREILVTLFAATWLFVGAARATVTVSVEQWPVALPGKHGRNSQTVPVWVTLAQNDTDTPKPWILLLHGRPTSPARFSLPGRHTYPKNAQTLAEMGFLVVIPTRIGYGMTSGPDLEFSGTCNDKHYEESMQTVEGELQQLTQRIQSLKHVDPRRGLVIGESFGGLIAVYLSAHPLPGTRAVVNFSGGDGGMDLAPETPCQPERLTQTFREWGMQVKLPSMWIYGLHDRYWGDTWPYRWFTAFTHSASVPVQWRQVVVRGYNGHEAFVRDPEAWRKDFEKFVHDTRLLLPD
jgi:pimeloyl-ACP methyl ester carboxylesterase